MDAQGIQNPVWLPLWFVPRTDKATESTGMSGGPERGPRPSEETREHHTGCETGAKVERHRAEKVNPGWNQSFSESSTTV